METKKETGKLFHTINENGGHRIVDWNHQINSDKKKNLKKLWKNEFHEIRFIGQLYETEATPRRSNWEEMRMKDVKGKKNQSMK